MYVKTFCLHKYVNINPTFVTKGNSKSKCLQSPIAPSKVACCMIAELVVIMVLSESQAPTAHTYGQQYLDFVTVSQDHSTMLYISFVRPSILVWRLIGNIIRTALCWIVWHNVYSLQHTYMSSSYRSNRLGLSHWDPYTVRRGGCLELYYCNMVELFSWDSRLILTTSWFPSVLWRCWFGHLACKNRPRNDLLCVEWDVKPYTLTPQYPSSSDIIDLKMALLLLLLLLLLFFVSYVSNLNSLWPPDHEFGAN